VERTKTIMLFITSVLGMVFFILWTVNDIKVQNQEGTIDSLNTVITKKDSVIKHRDSIIIDQTETKVEATMYYPVKSQCDNSPNITADGTVIDVKRAGSHKYIAMSRNMLERWGGKFSYGDYVVIKNAGHKDGIYKVVDTMNRRFTNRIDFLEDVNSPLYKYNDVVLFKYYDFLSPYI
jgi:3D (Asp-Asp-Asp) domain-containing protein